jgi:hypothetical protein
MKKIITLLFALMTFSGTVKAQDYYHGAGAQIYVGLFSEAVAIPAVFYKATLDFDGDFALSSYPFIGFQINSDPTGASGYFGVGLPVLVEKYFGDVDDECFYLGAGLEASLVGASGFGGGGLYGPHVGVGGQFYIKDNLIGIRAGYTFGLNEGNPMGIMGGVYYMFGQ